MESIHLQLPLLMMYTSMSPDMTHGTFVLKVLMTRQICQNGK